MPTKGQAVGIGVGSALVTYLITHPRVAKAAENPPAGVDPELWVLLVTQNQQINDLIGSIDNLITQLGAQPSGNQAGQDPFANKPKWTVGQVICNVINRGFQLPPIPIPKNKQLVVKALPGNGNWVWLASLQADSQNIGLAYPLLPQEAVGLFIQNANQVWVMALALNDGVAFMVEQE